VAGASGQRAQARRPNVILLLTDESKVYAMMRAYYGVPSDLALMERLHVDFRHPKPNWIGPELVDDLGRPTDYFGIRRTGAVDFGYPILHPLAHVQSVAEVEAYPKWPSADMWDYDRYTEDCKHFEEYAVYGGAWAWFFEAACELVGMDNFFLLVATSRRWRTPPWRRPQVSWSGPARLCSKRLAATSKAALPATTTVFRTGR
jgi:hypothetical protein